MKYVRHACQKMESSPLFACLMYSLLALSTEWKKDFGISNTCMLQFGFGHVPVYVKDALLAISAKNNDPHAPWL